MSDWLMTGRYSNGPPLPFNREGPPAPVPPVGAASCRPAAPPVGATVPGGPASVRTPAPQVLRNARALCAVESFFSSLSKREVPRRGGGIELNKRQSRTLEKRLLDRNRMRFMLLGISKGVLLKPDPPPAFGGSPLSERGQRTAAPSRVYPPQAFPSFDGFVDRILAKRKPQATETLPRGDPRNRGRPQSMPRGDPRAGPLEGRLIHDEPPD